MKCSKLEADRESLPLQGRLPASGLDVKRERRQSEARPRHTRVRSNQMMYRFVG